ncbi:hypothetical protein FIV42_19415 [Persicimonas caeni]|uniref:Histidine kinase n=1 Tax=Persicimonas caeni TaxID=2292766 RepID=A0A4Y6PYL8_PERCE|nr:FIST N-terminal domain-containing protein [Persicimonas caeni]QDG52835.1 hypothetical protein FIV42_19415 [Persicimonas caeni]QED34057.1 hypothetical protein FRD00_19410 [Persicimonas caeni]
MRCATAGSTTTDGNRAIEEAYEAIVSELGGAPDVLFLYASVEYDAAAINARLAELAEGAAIHGGTSCQGVMTQQGMFGEDGRGLALMALSDPEGAYGVGMAHIGDDPKGAAGEAVQQALGASGRIGEVPELIWVTAEPGSEEDVIAGIEALVGPKVPVLGGSAADNEVAGNWFQFANGEVSSNAVVVTAMFPSSQVGFSFHSGYEPTGHTGTVTRADDRILYEIDGRPAAEVYNEWTDGAVSDELDGGGNVLAKTSLHPLGREVGQLESTSYFQLSHPDQVTEDGALTLFSRVEEGEKLVHMTGTIDSLTTRAARVAQAALETTFRDSDEVAGALVIYCAGCMLTVQDRIDEVSDGLNEALGGKPYLGAFTFGEQGCFIGGENRHGNLMISVVTLYE